MSTGLMRLLLTDVYSRLSKQRLLLHWSRHERCLYIFVRLSQLDFFLFTPILCFNAESWSCRHLVLLKSTQHKDSGQYWDWNIYHSGVSTAPVTFSTIQEGWGLIKLNFQWIGLICNVNIFLLAYNYILGVLNLLHITFFFVFDMRTLLGITMSCQW